MAISATIYKTALNIADMDRHYYAEHNLTIAKHPSESELRIMVRLIAFILNADGSLSFSKGISQDDEPDLWKKALDGSIELWIDIGQPDEKRVKKACGRSEKVMIYTYQDGAARTWFSSAQKTFKRLKNLTVMRLNIEGDLEALVSRTMNIQCNISDAELMLLVDEHSVSVTKELVL